MLCAGNGELRTRQHFRDQTRARIKLLKTRSQNGRPLEIAGQGCSESRSVGKKSGSEVGLCGAKVGKEYSGRSFSQRSVNSTLGEHV